LRPEAAQVSRVQPSLTLAVTQPARSCLADNLTSVPAGARTIQSAWARSDVGRLFGQKLMPVCR
jgi:hypothetical protein